MSNAGTPEKQEVPAILFEQWLRGIVKSSVVIDGQDMNALLRTTWRNWWPFESLSVLAHYDFLNGYRVSPQGIVVYKTIKELYGKA